MAKRPDPKYPFGKFDEKKPYGKLSRHKTATAETEEADAAENLTAGDEDLRDVGLPGSSAGPAIQLNSSVTAAVLRSAPQVDQRRHEMDRAEDEEEQEPVELLNRLTNMPSWLTSMVVHIAVLMIMAFWMVALPKRTTITAVLSSADELEELDEFEIEDPEFEVEPEEQEVDDVPVEAPSDDALDSQIELVDNMDAGVDAGSPDLDSTPNDLLATTDLLTNVVAGGVGGGEMAGSGQGNNAGTGRGVHGTGGGIGGRGQRRGGAEGNGASPASEAAVDMALRWLAEHQLRNGSWNFDHRHGVCQGRCQNHGRFDQGLAAATGLGILPFLGAGQTHLDGVYKDNVAAALNVLIRIQEADGNCWEDQGQMYGHGIATMAMCEALAMSLNRPSRGGQEDNPANVKVDLKRLARAAQGAIRYIEKAQHGAGGWRYNPNEAGDTSVVGWQMMALYSGRSAGLRLRGQTIKGATSFLNSVTSDEYGSQYSYQPGGEPTPAVTSIGLLCRMYLGWARNHPGIVRGAELLRNHGPTVGDDVYFDYYATQVMHHYGGDEWEAWNAQMRDGLVAKQSQNGHETGSWSLAGHGSGEGGRHFSTCVAAMILEVYYRHAPMYRVFEAEQDLNNPNAANDDANDPADGDPPNGDAANGDAANGDAAEDQPAEDDFAI